MPNGFATQDELFDLENFLAWFIWRCRRYSIRSRWARGVAEHLAEKHNINVDKLAEEFDFENIWKEFIPDDRV